MLHCIFRVKKLFGYKIGKHLSDIQANFVDILKIPNSFEKNNIKVLFFNYKFEESGHR